MFALFQILYIEILTPNAMILGSGDFRRWLDHKNGALKNGISALIKETPESYLPHLHHVRTQQEDSHLWTKKGVLNRRWICQHLDLRRPSLQNC